MSTYSKLYNKVVTPQTSRAKAEQVENSAGGYVFALDPWKTLDRFLILGTMGGTYYASEKDITVKNLDGIRQLITEDPRRVVDAAVEVSTTGRAFKNDAPIFVLAMVAAFATSEGRAYAYNKLNDVCRIGTHLFNFMEAISVLKGKSGSGLRRALQRWYLDKNDRDLAYQLTKYKQRNGWSHRDVLRLAKPKTDDFTKNQLFAYATGHDYSDLLCEVDNPTTNYMVAVELVNDPNLPLQDIHETILHERLPREVIPTHLLNAPDVWAAMLEAGMPMSAMIRNLGKMGSLGLLSMGSAANKIVRDQLANVAKARVHPMQVLIALKTYNSGHGDKGSLTWTPVAGISTALEEAFYDSFQSIEPTGQRYLLGVDVSSSMTYGSVAGGNVSPHIASAVMAMVTARTEKEYDIMGFTRDFKPLGITHKDSLEEAIRKTQNRSFGGTDCALPMVWAGKHGVLVDTFVVYTDNETWAGSIHPYQALKAYRNKTGLDSKLIVVGMTATNFTIADPSDPGMLDVVGFDTATPRLISEFSKGTI
jgi:60 kDa SS-A/Ro ribonucleoprotein